MKGEGCRPSSFRPHCWDVYQIGSRTADDGSHSRVLVGSHMITRPLWSVLTARALDATPDISSKLESLFLFYICTMLWIYLNVGYLVTVLHWIVGSCSLCKAVSVTEQVISAMACQRFYLKYKILIYEVSINNTKLSPDIFGTT